MTQTTPVDDPFAQPRSGGGGNFPKLEELDKSLLYVTVSSVKSVPGYQNNGMVERFTCNVTVLNEAQPAASVTHKDMWLSSGGLETALRDALDNRRPILGRLTKGVGKTEREENGITSREILDAELAKHYASQGKARKPQWFWTLAEYAEPDAQVARAWLASGAVDPFAA